MGQLLLMRTTWALCEVLTLATGPIMTLYGYVSEHARCYRS